MSATGDVGAPGAMDPIIVIPPGNRSVVAGASEVTLECIANARYVAGLHVGTQIQSDWGAGGGGPQQGCKLPAMAACRTSCAASTARAGVGPPPPSLRART